MELLRRMVDVGHGRECCLATVIRTSGSTPRHPGAKMLVLEDGSTVGTIGGGRVELEVIREGLKVAGGAAARRVEHHLVRDLAMCCGGTMELYLEPLGVSAQVIADALDALEDRRAVELVTPLDGGTKSLRVLVKNGRSATRLEQGEFVEALHPPERALLFGAGHVAGALGPILRSLSFEVVVCDDNETGAVESEVPWASRVIESFEPREIERELGHLGEGDYAIILSRDHSIDQRILERLIGNQEIDYLGLIGSTRKVESFRKRLVAKELCDEESWSRVRAPIGIDIAAETPEEIAVSIAAELVQHRSDRRRGE